MPSVNGTHWCGIWWFRGFWAPFFNNLSFQYTYVQNTMVHQFQDDLTITYYILWWGRLARSKDKKCMYMQCTCTCTVYIYIYIYIYIYTYIYTHVYIYIYINYKYTQHMYTHIYIHVYILNYYIIYRIIYFILYHIILYHIILYYRYMYSQPPNMYIHEDSNTVCKWIANGDLRQTRNMTNKHGRILQPLEVANENAVNPRP